MSTLLTRSQTKTTALYLKGPLRFFNRYSGVKTVQTPGLGQNLIIPLKYPNHPQPGNKLLLHFLTSKSSVLSKSRPHKAPLRPSPSTPAHPTPLSSPQSSSSLQPDPAGRTSQRTGREAAIKILRQWPREEASHQGREEPLGMIKQQQIKSEAQGG